LRSSLNNFLPFWAFFLFVILFSVGLVAASSNSVEIIPSADTYVDVFNPTSNYGGTTSLELAYNEYSIEAIWLKFNLADRGIPEGVIIDDATLKVYPTIVFETFQVTAHYCPNNAWDEYTLSYVDQPIDYAVNSPSGLATTAVYSAYKWYSWDVTSAVQNTIANKATSSNLLTLVLSDNSWSTGIPLFQIGSREAGNRVILNIHWIASDPSTPSPSPSPTATQTLAPSVPELSSIVCIIFLFTSTMLAIILFKRKQANKRIDFLQK
jgi:hypothetical protein